MAQMTIIPPEHELHESIKAAQANGERLDLDARLASILAYGFYRYEEICTALRQAKLDGGGERAVRQICVLVGEHQALQAFAQGSKSVPLGVWEACDRALSQWTAWACLLLENYDEPHGDAGSTAVLQDKIGELCGALEGTKRRLQDETLVLGDENRGLHAKLRQWEEWAEQEAPKCTSAHEQRESIAARLRSG